MPVDEPCFALFHSTHYDGVGAPNFCPSCGGTWKVWDRDPGLADFVPPTPEPDIEPVAPRCPSCGEEMEPVIGAGTGPGLRYLWWWCADDRTTTAVVPVPNAGIPERREGRVL